VLEAVEGKEEEEVMWRNIAKISVITGLVASALISILGIITYIIKKNKHVLIASVCFFILGPLGLLFLIIPRSSIGFWVLLSVYYISVIVGIVNLIKIRKELTRPKVKERFK